MTDSCRVSGEVDIYAAAGMARKVARELGFGQADVARIEIVVRELASNIIRHAGSGRIRLRKVTQGHRQGIEIVALDRGPGIPDLDLALQDGFSTGDKGLGS
jgi:serine/threonine-protein kinase RsbT